MPCGRPVPPGSVLDMEPNGTGRNRVRRRNDERTTTLAGKVAAWRRKGMVVPVVTALLAILLATVLYQRGRTFYNSYWLYADVGVRDRPSDVLYSLGAPTRIERGGRWVSAPKDATVSERWAYGRSDGALIEVRFRPGGEQVDWVSCHHIAGGLGACPTTYGVGLGTAEDALFWKVGNPPSQRVDGDTKTVFYPTLGVAFELRRFAVVRIIHFEPQSAPLSLAWRYLLTMLPTAW